MPETNDSVFDKFAFEIFIFATAIVLLIVAMTVIMVLYKGAKMRALIPSVAMQKGVKALTDERFTEKYCTFAMQWTILALLLLALMGIIFIVTERAYRMPIFRKHQYSNIIKIMMFALDVNSYVPIKLCKVGGSIHLFKITGKLKRENITLVRNTIWNIIQINWKK